MNGTLPSCKPRELSLGSGRAMISRSAGSADPVDCEVSMTFFGQKIHLPTIRMHGISSPCEILQPVAFFPGEPRKYFMTTCRLCSCHITNKTPNDIWQFAGCIPRVSQSFVTPRCSHPTVFSSSACALVPAHLVVSLASLTDDSNAHTTSWRPSKYYSTHMLDHILHSWRTYRALHLVGELDKFAGQFSNFCQSCTGVTRTYGEPPTASKVYKTVLYIYAWYKKSQNFSVPTLPKLFNTKPNIPHQQQL